MVRIVEEDPRYGRDNKSTDIWRESRNMGDMWHRAAVPLPPIKNWYEFFLFFYKRHAT